MFGRCVLLTLRCDCTCSAGWYERWAECAEINWVWQTKVQDVSAVVSAHARTAHELKVRDPRAELHPLATRLRQGEWTPSARYACFNAPNEGNPSVRDQWRWNNLQTSHAFDFKPQPMVAEQGLDKYYGKQSHRLKMLSSMSSLMFGRRRLSESDPVSIDATAAPPSRGAEVVVRSAWRTGCVSILALALMRSLVHRATHRPTVGEQSLEDAFQTHEQQGNRLRLCLRVVRFASSLLLLLLLGVLMLYVTLPKGPQSAQPSFATPSVSSVALEDTASPSAIIAEARPRRIAASEERESWLTNMERHAFARRFLEFASLTAFNQTGEKEFFLVIDWVYQLTDEQLEASWWPMFDHAISIVKNETEAATTSTAELDISPSARRRRQLDWDKAKQILSDTYSIASTVKSLFDAKVWASKALSVVAATVGVPNWTFYRCGGGGVGRRRLDASDSTSVGEAAKPAKEGRRTAPAESRLQNGSVPSKRRLSVPWAAADALINGVADALDKARNAQQLSDANSGLAEGDLGTLMVDPYQLWSCKTANCVRQQGGRLAGCLSADEISKLTDSMGIDPMKGKQVGCPSITIPVMGRFQHGSAQLGKPHGGAREYYWQPNKLYYGFELFQTNARLMSKYLQDSQGRYRTQREQEVWYRNHVKRTWGSWKCQTRPKTPCEGDGITGSKINNDVKTYESTGQLPGPLERRNGGPGNFMIGYKSPNSRTVVNGYKHVGFEGYSQKSLIYQTVSRGCWNAPGTLP